MAAFEYCNGSAVLERWNDTCTHQRLYLARSEELVDLLDRFGTDTWDLPLLRSAEYMKVHVLDAEQGKRHGARAKTNFTPNVAVRQLSRRQVVGVELL